MKILAIETSCDDTCIAILEIKKKKLKILSNVISSQIKLHAKYGGVYPTLAKREHQRNLLPVLVQALKQSKLLKISNFKFPRPTSPVDEVTGGRVISKQILNSNFQIPKPNIDLIAVTNGPGLEPCLWTGINFAKKLAKEWKLPIIPVNHIEGHIFANWLMPSRRGVGPPYKLVGGSDPPTADPLTVIEFPAICLIVSGGHTQLILMQNIGKYEILGETRDDAAGECFDKTARMLGLGYPGGPAIAAETAKFQILNSKFKIKLPRPMMYQKHKRGVSRAKGERRVQSTLRPNYDFSFSGLKTAVLYEVKKKKKRNKKFISAMTVEIQQAIIDVLIYKTLKVAKDYQIKTIILGGGVTANNELCKQFKLKIKKELPQINLHFPDIKFCIDNAVMIGITAYFNRQNKTKNFKNIKANANLRI